MVDSEAVDEREFVFTQSMVEDIASWRDYDTFDNLLGLRDGPFASFGTIAWFTENERRFVRMIKGPANRFVDVEVLASGSIGEIRPVPVDEAIREAQRQGWI